MSASPEQDAERARVAVVHALQLLDTPAEARFDRITRMAQVVFDVPMAAISLIDNERQWFKSERGLGLAEVPRTDSFCVNTLTASGPFIIEDMHQDPRFSRHPLVQGAPNIRFYAGVGLLSAGQCVGSLCIMDSRPRAFSATASASLLDLGQWAEHEINQVSELHANAIRMESRLRLSAVLENALDGIVTLTGSGIVESANPAALSLFGYGHHALLNQDVRMLIPERARADFSLALQQLHTGELPRARSGLQVAGLHCDGSELALELSYNTVEVDSKRVIIAIVRDVSAQQRVDRMKQDFVATVSHELRTPLTAIIGALGLIREAFASSLDDTVRPLIDMAYQNSLRLGTLMQDIAELDQLDSGKTQLNPVRCELDGLLADLCQKQQPLAKAAGVELKLTLAPGLLVQVDAERLQWILARLLDNAYRFSSAGMVVHLDVSAFGGRVCFSVRDHGPGIPEPLRQHLFKRFSKIRHDNIGRQTGAGLSLYLCKVLVERMAGQIGYTAATGGGSRFFVTLPQIA